MRSITLALFTTSILALPACGSTPDETTSQSSGTDGDTTTAGTDPTTNPTSTTAPDGTTTGATTTGASDPTTDATTGVTTGPTSESGTTDEPGTTSTDGTTSGTTEPVDTTTTDGTTTEPVDTTTTDGTTTDGTTGAPTECAALGAMECQANEACMPLGGGKLNLMKMCVGKPMFVGCVDAGGCGDALTYACAPNTDPPEPWLFPSTCLPEGWEPCDAPPIDMPCK